MTGRLLAVLAFFACEVSSACVPMLREPERRERSTEGAPAEYPGAIRDPATVPGDFSWQQHIESTFPTGSASGLVVLEKVGPRLTAVGLTPFGTRAFVLEQVGDRVTFTKLVAAEVRVEPRVILVDINRAFFLRAGEPPRPDGVQVDERAGERVTERWKGGKLVERTFERPGGPKGKVTIRYEGGMRGFTPPRVVTLDNGWYGYRLRIETVSGGAE